MRCHRRTATAARRRRLLAACCSLLLPSFPPASDALLQPPPSSERAGRRGHGRGLPLPTATARGVSRGRGSHNMSTPPRHGGDSVDLFKTLELKDEALVQAQSAVSSLEKALGSAVTNLENLQGHLQLQVVELERELEATKLTLSETQNELDRTREELRETQAELRRRVQDGDRLESELMESRKAAQRADELESRELDAASSAASSVATPPAPRSPGSRDDSNPWRVFSPQTKVAPVLDEWIAIKGTNEGEVQISGKVTNHPTIPDGDAIVTSPLIDPSKASERNVVTTLSGSKYRLGTPMSMPSSDAQSVKITSEEGAAKQQPGRRLVKARSSISLPDLTGETLGNGRYLLAGEATSSINGRSYIQTVYRSSPFGKPMGEPLIVKYSSNTDAMKREFANYNKVSRKRGNFIRRVEFLPAAGSEMPEQSALVMQRGVADVKAFMPKVGGRLEGELLLDCALTALRCMEALHSVRLVWNDLKTENFVVIEDPKTGGVSFRGIDLESCRLVRTPPVDYTPEACPPEFARSFLDGEAETYSLEYSYDVWSFGMFLYEIATGRGFFDGFSAEKITKTLPTFVPNIAKVEDPVLADLIGQCLERDAATRPSVAVIGRHPFFASTGGKNPFDFLFGVSI